MAGIADISNLVLPGGLLAATSGDYTVDRDGGGLGHHVVQGAEEGEAPLAEDEGASDYIDIFGVDTEAFGTAEDLLACGVGDTAEDLTARLITVYTNAAVNKATAEVLDVKFGARAEAVSTLMTAQNVAVEKLATADALAAEKLATAHALAAEKLVTAVTLAAQVLSTAKSVASKSKAAAVKTNKAIKADGFAAVRDAKAMIEGVQTTLDKLEEDKEALTGRISNLLKAEADTAIGLEEAVRDEDLAIARLAVLHGSEASATERLEALRGNEASAAERLRFLRASEDEVRLEIVTLDDQRRVLRERAVADKSYEHTMKFLKRHLEAMSRHGTGSSSDKANVDINADEDSDAEAGTPARLAKYPRVGVEVTDWGA